MNLSVMREYAHDLLLALSRTGRISSDRGYVPVRAMVIAAHPDDPEFFVAGTVALWARQGAEIRYVLCTSGENGSSHLSLAPEELLIVREREQLAAARVTGTKDVVFLHQPDGLLESSISLRRQLVREIRIFRPEVVIIYDPEILYTDGFIEHPDHRAAARASLEALYPSAGTPNLFRDLEAEGLSAHTIRKLYVFTWRKPNTWVDITATIDTKIAALRQHVSQTGDCDHSAEIRQSAARSARFTGMKYAETFRVVGLMSDADWARSSQTT